MNLSIFNTHSGKLQPWPREVYDAFPAVRSTALKEIIEPHGPRNYYYKYVHPARNLFFPNDDESESMTLGTLFHALILEDRTCWHTCENHGASKDGKAERAEAIANGLTPITKSQHTELMNWRDGLFRNRKARSIIEAPRFPEQAIRFKKRVGNRDIDSKCLIDILMIDGEMGCLKTDRGGMDGKCTASEFSTSIFKYRYDFSAGFYNEGRAALKGFEDARPDFFHLVQFTRPPYYCYVVPLSTQWLRTGMTDVERGYHALARCLDQQDEILEAGGDPLDAWPDPEEQCQDVPLVPEDWQLSKRGVDANAF